MLAHRPKKLQLLRFFTIYIYFLQSMIVLLVEMKKIKESEKKRNERKMMEKKKGEIFNQYFKMLHKISS